MWLLLGAHFVVAGALAAGAARSQSGRAPLIVAAVPPAVTTLWALTRIGAEPIVVEHSWVAGLDLVIRLRLDALATLLTLAVSGIGAAVFVYAAGYFRPTAAGLWPFAATLLTFSASMLGLVWADSVWTLFIFWELTSITSFLLVGFRNEQATARVAARRALLITAVGGLILLAGLLVLVDGRGSAELTDIEPVAGATGALAATLVMVAAATKSAQVPFHVWLPGAMVAPTPVSAYLHSATMVKAGVILVAVLAPAFGDQPLWKILGLAFGLGSVVWGAVGALRHTDAKLILAWGTVSQLGLMVALLSLGSAKATFAAVALLTAHAVFKAALFMVVGEVDVRVGSRDITAVGGLWRSMPWSFGVAVVAAASMAGVPPLLGFPAKEAVVEAVLTLSGTEQWIAAVGLLGGSVLTVAYSLRLVIGLFGPGPEISGVDPGRSLMTVPVVILGAGSLVGYAALGWVDDRVGAAATELNEKASVYELYRWPGLTTGLAISLAIIALGAVLGWLATRVDTGVPDPVGAGAVDRLIDGTVRAAGLVTGKIQHGSLPLYLATTALVIALSALPFATGGTLGGLYRWDMPLQAMVGALTVAGAAGAAVMRSRLGAALGLGFVGFGVSALFFIQGAPDLALTQLLVETVVVVGFVVGLGRLTRRFPPVDATWRSVRLVVAAAMGVAVMAGLAMAASGPVAEPPTAELVASAVDPGGGNNVVNVVLTDVRALDTFGEVVVLAVAAAGILALATRNLGAGAAAVSETSPEVTSEVGT